MPRIVQLLFKSVFKSEKIRYLKSKYILQDYMESLQINLNLQNAAPPATVQKTVMCVNAARMASVNVLRGRKGKPAVLLKNAVIAARERAAQSAPAVKMVVVTARGE